MARLLYIIVAFFVLSAFVNSSSQLQGNGRSYPVQQSSTKFLTNLLRQTFAIVRDQAHSDDYTPVVQNQES